MRAVLLPVSLILTAVSYNAPRTAEAPLAGRALQNKSGTIPVGANDALSIQLTAIDDYAVVFFNDTRVLVAGIGQHQTVAVSSSQILPGANYLTVIAINVGTPPGGANPSQLDFQIRVNGANPPIVSEQYLNRTAPLGIAQSWTYKIMK